MIDDEPRSATVIAWGDVEVLRAERALHAAVRKRLAQATRKISDSDLAMERRIAKALTDLIRNDICEVVDGDIAGIRVHPGEPPPVRNPPQQIGQGRR